MPTPPVGSKKRWWLWLIVAVVLAGAAFAAWRLLQATKPTTSVETKQDIPLIKYGTTDGPINSFYPEMGLVSAEFDVNQQVFEGLVRYQSETKIVPLLATDWNNPDDTTWVFNLKRDVKFHTGNTMTAKDVKFSLDLIRESDSDVAATFASSITGVEVVGDYQIKITTDGPDPVLLNKLNFLYILDSSSEIPDDPVNGTGPYIVKPDTTPSEENVSLVAFDGYHGGHVYTREVQFMLYPSEEELAADFKDGKVQIAGSFILTDSLTALKGSNPELFSTNSLNVTHFGLNLQKADSPLGNLKVRQALYLASDAAALLKARGSQGTPIGQIVPDEIPGFNPAIERPKTDVAKAKQLLTDAGYPNGLTLNLSYVEGDPPETITEIKRQLAEIGVTLNLDPLADINALITKIFDGSTDLYLTGYGTDVLDAIDVFGTFFDDSANYSNPKVTELISEANTTLDQSKRLALLQEISQLVMDDVAWIPLWVPTLTWSFDKPYVVSRDVPGGGFGVYFWQVYTR